MLVNGIINFGWCTARGCSCLSCTNRTVGATAWLVHCRGCTAGGAAVSAAPTELLGCCLVGALLALASGKAERRQVHPLRLLHEQLLHLAVGCAHDVDATLEVLYAYSAEVVYLDVGIVVGSG